MLTVKEKSPKSSTKRQARTRRSPQVSSKRIPARSAMEVAEQSCNEMIQNLKRNVAERKRRATV